MPENNLNIARYIESSEEEPPIILSEVTKELRTTCQEIDKSQKGLNNMLDNLKTDNKEQKISLRDLMKVIEEI